MDETTPESGPEPTIKSLIAQRFRGFLPVVIDVETGGFNSETDALLEIAAVIPRLDGSSGLCPEVTISTHVEPFKGANLDPKSLAITGIDPHNPLRAALPEHEALTLNTKP
jgi:ribonuclease T